MNAIGTLLDNAKRTTGTPSDLALAAKLGKSRALVSEWRKGTKQVQDDDIARLAALARSDAGAWLVAVHAEAVGPAGTAWKEVLRRLALPTLTIMSNAWGRLRSRITAAGARLIPRRQRRRRTQPARRAA